MRCILAGTLAVGVAVCATNIQAHGDNGPRASTASAVMLGRPSGASIMPTSFNQQQVRATSTVRAQNPEPPQPMPLGAPTSTNEPPKGAEGTVPRRQEPIATSPLPPAFDAAPRPGTIPTFSGDPWCGSPGPYCDDPCVPPCPTAAPCFWFRGEYLLWNLNDSNTPPLVTTSPATSLGVIGQPGTQVLFGGDVQHNNFSGGRFTLGFWCDPCESSGVEANFFFLGERSVGFTASSTGVPLLARPFFNADPANPGEDAQLIANPLVPQFPTLLPLAGTVNINLASELWGADVNWICNLRRYCCGRTDFLVGMRYMRLRESLDITENLLVLPNNISPELAGTQVFINDHFATRNWFFGGQLGLRQQFNWRNWQLDLTGKVALGSTHQRVNIDGLTAITPPGGATSSFTGGLLALPTNIGEYSRSVFSVVPEAGVTLGYQINENWRLTAGYTLVYWNNVARPGDQIDRVVNATQLPPRSPSAPFTGPARPLFQFANTDLWRTAPTSESSSDIKLIAA